MLCSITVALALAASAFASVFVIFPTGSTTLTAGQPANVSWIDDNNAPSLAEFGLANIAVYTGNADEQTLLQTVATYVDVSNQSSVLFTPQGGIGPDSGEYFIRVTSISYKSSSSPQYPQESFSSKFSMAGMSGSFNSTVQAEINGQSTAPIGGTSVASTPAATGASSVASATSAAPAASSASPSSSSSSSSSSTNGAGKPVVATGMLALVATLVGASFL